MNTNAELFKRPTLSFIVPVYKIPEHLLRQTLESMLRPSSIDLELICIDDSPGERSSEILAEFAQKDSRVRVLTNDHNRGVSYSRNRGIEAAQGEYIAFQDADDLAILDGYEHLIAFSIANNLDMARGAYSDFMEETLGLPHGQSICYFADDEGSRQRLPLVLAWFGWSVWGGIYKRTALKGISFYHCIRHYEDSVFNAQLMATMVRIGILNIQVLRLVGHPNSLSRTLSKRCYLEFALAASKIAKIISGNMATLPRAIVYYYARRAIFILFADMRGRQALQISYTQDAFMSAVIRVEKSIEKGLPLPLRLGLKMVSFCPVLLFRGGGIAWKIMKLCMKVDDWIAKHKA